MPGPTNVRSAALCPPALSLHKPDTAQGEARRPPVKRTFGTVRLRVGKARGDLALNIGVEILCFVLCQNSGLVFCSLPFSSYRLFCWLVLFLFFNTSNLTDFSTYPPCEENRKNRNVVVEHIQVSKHFKDFIQDKWCSQLRQRAVTPPVRREAQGRAGPHTERVAYHPRDRRAGPGQQRQSSLATRNAVACGRRPGGAGWERGTSLL